MGRVRETRRLAEPEAGVSLELNVRSLMIDFGLIDVDAQKLLQRLNFHRHIDFSLIDFTEVPL